MHGAAAGAGLSLMLMLMLMLMCNFVLAEFNLGTSCDVGASWALARLVGLGLGLINRRILLFK